MPLPMPRRLARQRRSPASLASALALALVAAGPLPAMAATSACRAIAESTACTAVAECTWVAAYKTKKGKEIAAYCRLKRKASVASSGPTNARAPGSSATTAASTAN